jgi:dolichol-phosphate mannosyltransferase
METIVRLKRSGFNIKEIPINFRNRIHGKSKIPKIEIFRTLKNVILLYFKN